MTRAALTLALFAAVLTAVPSAEEPTFAGFVDDYYAKLFRWDPTQATYAGIHDFDDRLPDLGEQAIAARIESLRESHKSLATLRAKKLPEADAIDAEVLDSAIRAELHELEVVKDWQRNPVLYLGKPAEAIDLLMKRNYAAPAVRLRAVVARVKAAPALVAAAKANVKNPPKEFADLGLIVAKGSVGFFKNDLPAWAKTAAGDDRKLLADFEAANAAAIEAFESAAAWVEKDLLPNAKGKYAIGAEAYAKKLELKEMIDIPLPKLLEIAEATLKRDREDFARTAAKIDPKRTPVEVLALLTDDVPKPEDLVAATRGTIERTRQFLIDKKIVTVPSEVRPTIAETPAFMRTGGFASMDTPGAFEKDAKEAFYYVTPPETEWENMRKLEHMRQFNRTALDVITIHEAYPGHYLQFLNAKSYPTKVRKLYTCGSNVEGWAHYTEQMMIEEGFGNGDPKVRLAMLSEALLRDCRFVVGIKLHTADWTVEDGKKFFVEQGYIEPEAAFQESRRGTYNPTYLYYTVGKLQVYKLRADAKAAQGDKFDLRAFHDSFVKQGGLPIKLIRKILLPGDTSPSL